MPSKQTEELKTLYQSWVAAFAANPNMALDAQREMIEHWGDVTAEPGSVDYIETDAGGVPAMWAAPKGGAENLVVLCLHGGGFVSGSMYTHRKVYGHLAKAIGARALITHYRRTPEHMHSAQVEDAIAAYRWLLDQGIKPNHIALAGDSAGGGLAVSALFLARKRRLPMPAASMPLSPWVDMELTGETLESNLGKDALFPGKEAIEPLVGMFLGQGGDRRDPLASPLYGDFRGLPRFTSKSAAMSCWWMIAAGSRNVLARPVWTHGSISSRGCSTASSSPPAERPKPMTRSADWPNGYDPNSVSAMPRRPDRTLLPALHRNEEERHEEAY